MWSSGHKVLLRAASYSRHSEIISFFMLSIFSHQNYSSTLKMDGRAESKYSHILLGKYNDKSKKIIMVNRISPAIHAVLLYTDGKPMLGTFLSFSIWCVI